MINIPTKRFAACLIPFLFLVLLFYRSSSPATQAHSENGAAVHDRKLSGRAPIIELTDRPNPPYRYDRRHYDYSEAETKTSNASLVRRDYTCGPGNPCSNGACCGGSGFCGYGNTYCGTGCVSNCGATAECGQFSNPAGKTCPLNTCCSEFGFCGTTLDFCGTNCQSNCVLHPSPPASNSVSQGNVRKRVIGYYESWMARRECHKRFPSDLPLTSLTHLNYAFGYINPSTFEITTMDPQTDAQLFWDVAEAKIYNPDLEVFLSIGGWTFSDNNTATQPVFGNIASTETNRQTFANNLVKFLKHYGYNGIDIDWEYPGAPDRGGHPDDVQNFVSMMKTIRQTFDASGSKYGLTYTAPTSYWYLRWFDLKGLSKYTDWVNVMSYDLHGEWDRNNPIGSIVQAHTNLTEIKIAFELFWRNDISPSSLVMGFGFYGRSFQLASASCTTPGCAFAGTALPGPCSDTGGILMYYEIMALMAQNPSLTPVWDHDAAVKYLVYGDGKQWISYDDADTWKQKVDWANGLGLGGSLIWASDADDDKFTAHAGLLGTNVGSIKHPQINVQKSTAFVKSPATVAKFIKGSSAQQCYKRLDHCVKYDDTEALRNGCRSGETIVGLVQNPGCKKGENYPICCPAQGAPVNCIWRGGTGGAADCNGQCHAGEVKVFGDSWGGQLREPGTDTAKCNRGIKVFCCEAPLWDEVKNNCRWAKTYETCGSDETVEARKKIPTQDVSLPDAYEKLCCKSPSLVHDCRWEDGSKGADCVDANCKADEVELARDSRGDGTTCGWKRQKALCCKTHIPATDDQNPVCPRSCTTDPDLCNIDGLPQSLSVSDLSELRKRGRLYPVDITEHVNNLRAREAELAKRRTIKFMDTIKKFIKKVEQKLPTHPSRGDYLGRAAMTRVNDVDPAYFRADSRRIVLPGAEPLPSPGTTPGQVLNCLNGNILRVPIANQADIPPRTEVLLEAEHPTDANLLVNRFIETLLTGRLMSGDMSRYGKASIAFINDFLLADNVLPANGPAVSVHPSSSGAPYNSRSPIMRLLECLGSYTNSYPFLLLEGELNGMKGRLTQGVPLRNMDKITKSLNKAVAGTDEDFASVVGNVKDAHLLFQYLQSPQFQQRNGAVFNSVATEADYIARNNLEVNNLRERWIEFIDDAQETMGQDARNWGDSVIGEMRSRESRLTRLQHFAPNYVRSIINVWKARIPGWRWPKRK